MKPEDLDALRAALGAEAIREHPPVQVDGVPIGVTLVPSDGSALSEALRILSERRLAAVVCGGGTRLGLGNPPRRADCLLSTGSLTGIEELDGDEGVVRLGAGTKLLTLREEARRLGWEPPLEAPGSTSSVGGVLAAAALGPRSHGFGRARDAVLGLDVVLPSGARTHCGGRVVKNVTGYDLQKLYTGSLGTLGVIEAAWLRLRPLPQRVELMVARLTAGYEPLVRGLEVAEMQSARAVAVVEPPLTEELDSRYGDATLLLVELSGDDSVVKSEKQRLTLSIGARSGAVPLLDRVCELQGVALGPEELRIRVDVLPKRLPEAARRLRRAGARLLCYPGLGLLFARFRLDDNGDAAIGAAREAAQVGGGGFLLEEAPPAVKRGRDVFGETPDAVEVMRALKRQYDPDGVLNPGRFLGGI